MQIRLAVVLCSIQVLLRKDLLVCGYLQIIGILHTCM